MTFSKCHILQRMILFCKFNANSPTIDGLKCESSRNELPIQMGIAGVISIMSGMISVVTGTSTRNMK